MKKLLALVLVCVMVAGLFAGCSGSKPAETAAPKENAPAAPEAQPADPLRTTPAIWWFTPPTMPIL